MSALQDLEEIQLLQAMFMDDLLLDETDDQLLGKVELPLKPNVADNDDACFIQCRIVIKLDKEVLFIYYFSNLIAFSIRPPYPKSRLKK